MRKPPHQRRIEAYAVELQSDVFDLLPWTNDPVHDGRLADDVDDAPPGIERRVRILEDHLHLELLRARRGGRERRERSAAPEALAFRQREEADRKPSQRRLAAPRFADESDDLTLVDRQVDAIDRMHDPLSNPAA